VDSSTAISPQVAAITTVSKTLKKNAEDLTQLKNTIAENKIVHPPPSQSTNAHSYSAIIQQNMQTPAPVSAALSRAATKEHQILFEPATGEKIYKPNDNSTEIAKKFEQAFSTVQSEDSPALQIKATTRL
jgi:hypothetical protein